MAYRQAVTNEERTKKKRPSKFAGKPTLTSVDAQANLARRNQAQQAQQAKNAADAQARAQAATNNGKPSLRNKPVPGVTKAIKTQPTASGARVSLGAEAQQKVGYDADATRQVIQDRKLAEVDAAQKALAEKTNLRNQFVGRNPEMKNAPMKEVDRALRMQGRVERAQAGLNAGPNTPETADKLTRQEFKAQSALNQTKQVASTPQVSDVNQKKAAVEGSKARDYGQRLQKLKAAAGDNPSDNVKKEINDLQTKYDNARGKSAIAGTNSSPSADTQAKKADLRGARVQAAKDTVQPAVDATVDAAGKVQAKGEEVLQNVKDAAPEIKQRTADTVSGAKQTVTDAVDTTTQAAKDAGTTVKKGANDFVEGVTEGLQSSEVGDAGKKTGETLKNVGDQAKAAGTAAKEGAETLKDKGAAMLEEMQAKRAANKEAKAAKKARSRRIAGGAMKLGGLASLPGVVGEIGANIQEEGGVGAGLAKTGSNLLTGVADTVDTAGRTIEKRGLRSGIDALQGLGEGILEGADATGRAVVAGAMAPVDDIQRFFGGKAEDRSFSDIYRGMEGRSALAQAAQRSVADREARLAEPDGGGVMSRDPATVQPGNAAGAGAGGTPPATPAEIAQNTLIPDSDQIGTSGFRRADLQTGGFGGNGTGIASANYNAQGPNGSYLEGTQNPNARGGGTFNVMQGPGGKGASVADNVAAYDRQTAAIRGLRDYARESQGYAPVGQRTHQGYAETGFGDRMRQKNAMRSRPELDKNLTAKQNAYRLAEWQAGVDQNNIQAGIDPRSGAVTGERGLQGRFGGGTMRDQIALANFQRQVGQDQFSNGMKQIELGMKNRDFAQRATKDERDFMGKTQGLLASDNPAEKMQGVGNLIQAYSTDPNSAGGMMALQTLGQMFPEAAQDERGLINWVQGLLMGGEYGAVGQTADPVVAQGMANNMQPGSNPLFGRRIGTPGNNYFYENDDPAAYALASGVMGANQRNGFRQ